jgi:hypothetical protein
MIPQVLFAFVVAAVTLSGVYAGQKIGAPDMADQAEMDAQPDFDFYKTDLVAIPYVHGNDIVGYIIGRFTIKMDRAKLVHATLPVEVVVSDALNRHFYEEGEALSSPAGWTKLRKSLADLRDLANESAGDTVVLEVLIDQLDFLEKDEVRMPSEVARSRE